MEERYFTCNTIRGFNYQPSWGSSGFEIWRNFNPDRMHLELERAKKHFPGMNSVRFWLCHDAWLRNPVFFEDSLEQALSLFDLYSLKVMPVLFNRWHDPILDYGGIYIDHFLSGGSWLQMTDQTERFAMRIVQKHAEDDRIFAWDLCNEPYTYLCPTYELPDITRSETAWLKMLHNVVKTYDSETPVTISLHNTEGVAGMRLVEDMCDILCFHPYWQGAENLKSAFEAALDDYVKFATASGKPLLATETCWGSTCDAERVETILYTLNELQKREIGWLAYVLNHSLIADSHREEFGPLHGPGNLSFIEADGTLRPGHGVINDFMSIEAECGGL